MDFSVPHGGLAPSLIEFHISCVRSGDPLSMPPLPVVLCLALAGCSSISGVSGGSVAAPVAAPDMTNTDVVKAIRKIAAEVKLVEPWEMSAPIRSNPINMDPWEICLRSGAPGQPAAQMYSLMFNANAYTSYHWSAIVDQCQTQAFGPVPAEEKPPPPQPEVSAARRKKSKSNSG
jgi:hypothetical protein